MLGYLLAASVLVQQPGQGIRQFISVSDSVVALTNVRVIERDGDELTVESSFHLYRTRLESDQDFWMGRRRDVL